MRKLVSIRKIKEVLNHPNADMLEIAVVDGWKCVVKRGEFKSGDLGVYFEIDSFLPLEPEFEFLRKSSYKKMGEKEGIRLKTIKLRGELSQGLILPYSSVERFFTTNPFNVECDTMFRVENTDDLSELIGVEKYEPPIPASLSGNVEGVFPSFIKKTDQERIQNLYDSHSRDFSDNNDVIASQLKEEDEIKFAERIKELLENRTINEIKYMEFEETLKLDGTSMTCFVVDTNKYKTNKMEKIIQNGETLNDIYFGVCGRNFEISEKEGNTYWDTANKGIKEKMIDFLEKTGRSIAIQGELMGEGIQKNREQIKGHKFFCFDIWDIDKQRYLTSSERSLILHMLEIDSVPVLKDKIKVFQEFNSLEEILKYAEGKSIVHPVREGIVFKSKQLLNGNTISFKAINNQFLLKGGD